MKSFYLNCWVPSQKTYVKLAELKMNQFDILSKYIANNDDENTAMCLENLIESNLQDKSIFNELTRFDKWFMLTFLRASSISPSLYFNTKDVNNNDCNLEFNLFNILTELSEPEFDAIDPIIQNNVTIVAAPSRRLHVNDIVLDNLFSITTNNETFYLELLSDKEKRILFSSIEGKLKTDLLQLIDNYDKKYTDMLLIKSNSLLQNFASVKLRLFDNTLYNFIVMIYKPFAKNIYKKKYTLLTKLGLSLSDINDLTPIECDVYTGMLAAELKESKKTPSYK